MSGQRLTDAVAAARQFVADKSAADRIAVVVFGSKAVQLTGFSSSTIDADDALRTMAVDSKSGTALYDGVALSTQLLAKQQGRARVVVLLTDGKDVSSKTPLQDAIAGAKRPRCSSTRSASAPRRRPARRSSRWRSRPAAPTTARPTSST